MIVSNAPIDDHNFSGRICDASIAKQFSRDMVCVCIVVSFSGTAPGATNTALINSKRIAVRDSTCVFATDVVGTETIAKGSDGK